MPGERILVVDDECHIREVIRIKLEIVGYVVQTASSGPQALEMATEFRPDLIITDYTMPPGLDGLPLLRAFRECEATAGKPILLVTGSVAITNTLESKMLEFSHVTLIKKPFSPRNLLLVVQKNLDTCKEKTEMLATRTDHG
ncbi:response regulator [bacterium]|nr:response regulator [bacterium]